MAIAEEVLFLNDISCTIREHTTNVKSEVRRHKIKKYSDLIASQCMIIDYLCMISDVVWVYPELKRYFFETAHYRRYNSGTLSTGTARQHPMAPCPKFGG